MNLPCISIRSLTITFLLLLLSACGGGSGGFGDLIATGGIGGTGKRDISIGSISSFGSVFVNGVRFDTQNAKIIINGQEATENQLQVGMVVRIESTKENNKNQALSVHFNENVKGPIQAIHADHFIVLGQRIYFEKTTIFDGNINTLKIGDIVNVSGLIDTDNTIRATWIALENASQEFEVLGAISQLNTIRSTFMIGTMLVDYSQAQLFNFSHIENGLFVEVKGRYINSRLVATVIEKESFDLSDVTEIEIEGFISNLTNINSFTVEQFPVTYTAQTLFKYGTAADLKNGVKVEIEGQLNNQGTIILDEIKFLDVASQRTPSGRIGIEADIEAIEGNTVTLLGLSINMTTSTQFRDQRDGLVPYGIDQLQVGDRLAMSGFLDLTNNSLVAETIVREVREDAEVQIVGPVDNLNSVANSFSILGIQIFTDANTLFEDETTGNTEQLIKASVVLPNLQQSLIEVSGIFTGNSILATKLEIED